MDLLRAFLGNDFNVIYPPPMASRADAKGGNVNVVRTYKLLYFDDSRKLTIDG